MQEHRIIDLLCRYYERHRTSGYRIEHALPQARGWLRERLLLELLICEIELTWAEGKLVAKADYLKRFVDDSEIVERAFREADWPRPTGHATPPCCRRKNLAI